MTPQLLKELATEIYEDGGNWEFGEAAFTDIPHVVKHLRKSIEDNEPGFTCSDHASWGRFDNLEKWLTETAKLPWKRQTSPKHEYDGEIVYWFPGMDVPIEVAANDEGDITIKVTDLKDAMCSDNPLKAVEALIAENEVPDLPPLEEVLAVETEGSKVEN